MGENGEAVPLLQAEEGVSKEDAPAGVVQVEGQQPLQRLHPYPGEIVHRGGGRDQNLFQALAVHVVDDPGAGGPGS